MSNHDHDVKVLNTLIETTIDSADGYDEAAKDSHNHRYTSTFQTRAKERREVSAALQRQVRALGGKPEEDGSVLASAHRMFVNLRASISKGDRAVIEEVERGEDHIKHQFEDALQDDQLSAATRLAISDAFSSVKAGHDQMRDLKQALQGQS